jgi:hypothetical protein
MLSVNRAQHLEGKHEALYLLAQRCESIDNWLSRTHTTMLGLEHYEGRKH